MEHVAGGKNGLSVVVVLPIGAHQIAVAADDLLLFGIPDNELFVAVLADIELVDVDLLTRTSSCFAEGNFT